MLTFASQTQLLGHVYHVRPGLDINFILRFSVTGVISGSLGYPTARTWLLWASLGTASVMDDLAAPTSTAEVILAPMHGTGLSVVYTFDAQRIVDLS